MITREGTNCWQVTKADKISFLIDGAEFYEAFVRGARKARQSIYIAGWDMDSRVKLDRRDRFSGKVPKLGEFLNQLAQKNKSLHIYVLIWDFPMMYLRERQWLPTLHLGWNTHRRVHFQLDSEHPIGGSHHQKVIVVDDKLAFCGGLDLTKNRWDTGEHRESDNRRVDSEGNSYSPFHDVQMSVNGQTAEILGRLFRKRWKRATGKTLSIPENTSQSGWPDDLPADIASPCRVAVARTLPEYKEQNEVREVEKLFIDAIRSAQHLIYIENQYLTADNICQTLAERLAENDPPEILLVLPDKASGWLEQSTMDAIRRHKLQYLAKMDHKNRLGVYFPVKGKDQVSVYIHSKLMVVDDCLAIVGSANLSNRSMGLDTECCLAVEDVADSEIASGIAEFRRRLMAEHLQVSPEKIATAEQPESRLLRVVNNIDQSGSCLKPLNWSDELIMDGTEWVGDYTYIDPKEPFMPDKMMDHFLCKDHGGERGMSLVIKGVVFLSVLVLLAGIWRWSPLADWLTLKRMVEWAGLLNNIPLVMAAVVIGFIVGGLAFVPITLMIGVTAVILSPWQSFVCATAGTVLNAWVTYYVGRIMGKQTVRKLAGNRLDRLNKYLARQGVLAMAVVRNIPVAPFTIVNIAAGTTGIKVSHYLTGTAIGMLPGILAITLLTDRMIAMIKNPNWINISVAIGVAGAAVLGFYGLRKRIRNKA